MSLVSALKTLFIPLKSSNDTDSLDTDWRTLEIWAQQVVAAIKSISGGGGGYASLTGPGQTSTPGALTQEGTFTVIDDSAGFGVQNNADTNTFSVGTVGAHVTFGSSAGAVWTYSSFEFNNPIGSSAWQVVAGPSGNQSILQITNTNFTIQGGTIRISGPVASGVDVTIAGGLDSLGFFGRTPITIQSGGGITTVAQLVTALQNYGLLS